MADKKAKAFFKIVIPNYNNIAYAGRCLDSVFQQTFGDFFVVFVDDQSTDFSYELAKSYERRFPGRMAVLRAETKRYAGGCRNIGIDYPVECEYVYFIDSDDYLYSDMSLRKIYDALGEKPDMLLIGWC
jgi:glycosyltransferase involved in cell wall biosynthesis